MRIETESQESAIEKYIAKSNKKGKLFQPTGSLNNGEGIEETAMAIISRNRNLILIETPIRGQVRSIRLLPFPKKEIAYIKV